MLIDLGKRKYQVIGLIYTKGQLVQLTVAWLYPDKRGRVKNTKSIRYKHLKDYLPKFDFVVYLHDDRESRAVALQLRKETQEMGVLAGAMELRYKERYNVPPTYEQRTTAAMKYLLESHDIYDSVYIGQYMTEDELINIPPPAHILLLDRVTL